jgi:hypothetical protein
MKKTGSKKSLGTARLKTSRLSPIGYVHIRPMATFTYAVDNYVYVSLGGEVCGRHGHRSGRRHGHPTDSCSQKEGPGS